MTPSNDIKNLLDQLTTGQQNGACVSPREVLRNLLSLLYLDALASEAANRPKSKTVGKTK